jgi:hypothetical protein
MQLNTILRDGVGILELRANFDGRALRVSECGESRFNARDLSLDKDIRVSGSQSPNDPKLSDRGGRRGTCTVGGKAAAEAGAVTHGAVRCSARVCEKVSACRIVVLIAERPRFWQGMAPAWTM